MIQRFFCIVSVVSLLFTCSINLSDSGSGSEAGNAKIVGTIIDASGNPVDSALVTLTEKTDSIFYCKNTTATVYDTSVYTDSKGKYVFNLPQKGIYQITVEKENRFIAFIDSIPVFDTITINLPTDTVKAPGCVIGKAFLEDTAGVAGKQIRITCFEKKDKTVAISHGETFLFSDMPQGQYNFYCSPESGLFAGKWVKTEVISGDTSDLGEIILKKTSNYLLSSNVMTGEFIGHENVPVNKIPEYTFTVAPQSIVLVKVLACPEEAGIKVDAVITADKVSLMHQSDFPRGTEIGVYLCVILGTGEKVGIDFITEQDHHFTTQN